MLRSLINHLPDRLGGLFIERGFLARLPASVALHVPGPRLNRSPSCSVAGRGEHLGTDSWRRVAARLAFEAVPLLAALQERGPSHSLVLDPVLEVLVLADGGGGDDDSRRLLWSLWEASRSQAVRSWT